jgi:hypothetical protein
LSFHAIPLYGHWLLRDCLAGVFDYFGDLTIRSGSWRPDRDCLRILSRLFVHFIRNKIEDCEIAASIIASPPGAEIQAQRFSFV